MLRSARAAGVLAAVLSQRRATLADSSTTNSLRQGTAANAQGIQDSVQHTTLSPTTYGKKAQISFNNNPSSAQQNKPQQQQQKQSQEPYPPSLKEGKHFAVLTANGTSAPLSSIVKAVQQADVVILGEYHDDPVAHALELELLKRTAQALGYVAASPRCSNAEHRNSSSSSSSSHQQQQVLQGAQQSSPGHVTQQQQQQEQGKKSQLLVPQRPLLLSLEMFERDVQPVLDEYITGTATYADLLRDSRPWPNYRRDYHPLVEYCKTLGAVYNSITAQATGGDANSTAISASMNSSISATSSSSATRSNSVTSTGSSSSCSGSIGVMPYIKVIAANAPRRYVSLAGRSGRQALLNLPAASRAYLAPLPYAQPSAAYTDKVQTSMRQAAVEMQRHRERQHKKKQQQSEGNSMADEHSDSTPQQQQNRSAAAQGSTEQSSTAGTQQPQTPAGLVSTPAAPAAAAAGHRSGGEEGACPYIGFNVSSNFLDAQCLWDATMAYAIAEQLHSYRSPCTAAVGATQNQGREHTTRGSHEAGSQTHGQPLIVHVCGKFHAELGLGIPEHLEVYAPGKRVLVVVFVPRDSMAVNEQQLEREGLKGLADFVVLTDASLPRSFATVHPV